MSEILLDELSERQSFFFENEEILPINFSNNQHISSNTDEDESQEIKEVRTKQQHMKKMIKKNSRKKQKGQENRVLVAKDFKVQSVTLFLNPIIMKNIFTIKGDYFIDLGYDKKTSIEDQINYFKGVKNVLFATKNDHKGMVYLDIITDSDLEYPSLSVIQGAIQKRNDPMFFNYYHLFQQYYDFLDLNKRNGERLMEMMSQSTYDTIREKRRVYFDMKIEEYMNANFNNETDFYLFYKYCQNKPTDNFLQYKQVGVSYPLIALLGTDPSSYCNICLRKGFLEFTINKDKQIQVLHSLICRLTLLSDKRGINILHQEKETQLLTFDEYEISTQLKVVCFKVEFPPELQLYVDGFQQTYELPVFLQYNIHENVLQSLIAKRAKNPQFQQQWENEEFGYTLESQMFLEKYYNDFYKSQIPIKEQKYQHQLKYYYNKECGYKSIQTSCCENKKTQLTDYKSILS